MDRKDPTLYLLHISECCERILEYTAGLGSRWAESQLILDAVCRNVEIIGEAAGKLDPAFRQEHPQIPWRAIIDTRNLLIHAYDQVSAPILGNIVERDIPALSEGIHAILRARRATKE